MERSRAAIGEAEHNPAYPADMEPSHRAKGLVRLTMACNERCPFCNVPAEDYPSRPTAADEIEAQLAQLAASGERTLTISGGEPTLLRKRLVPLVARARALGMDFVELQTNAVLVDQGYANELATAGLTSAFVSLLSHEPAHHDTLAGLEGAFPRCVAGIQALLGAGVAVTLNPVFASTTQHTVVDYVRWVKASLPGVQHISLSAVQPHGRGARNLHLLPDYAVLGPQVAQARHEGLTVLNPFCGLPLCAGWSDQVDQALREAGPTLQNEGNKSHGRPCVDCTLRPSCPGAWHAYWTERRGSGLAAVGPKFAPWDGVERTQGAVRWGLTADALDVTDLALRFSREALALRRDDVALTVGVFGGSEATALEATRRALETAERVELRGHDELAAKLARAGLAVSVARV